MVQARQVDKLRIAVIGAGIVGVSTALWLQRDGHDVVLIDREGPAAGASYGNGGVLAACAIIPVNAPGLLTNAPGMLLRADSPLFLRWSYLPKLLPWLMRYLARANDHDTRHVAKALHALIYDSYEQHLALARGTGAARWLKPSDYLYVYKDRHAFQKDALSWALRRDMGVAWQELEGAALQDYDPIFSGTRNFAVRMAGHGTITDPGKYVEALCAHFQHKGGELLIANVQDFERSEGSVSGVTTEAGHIDCDAMVLAGGVWSKPLAQKLGLSVPMESERGYHIDLINPSVMPRAPMMLASGKFVVTPMEGRIRCAGIVEFGGLNARASRGPIALLQRQIHEAIPGLHYERFEQWMGHRPATCDSIPFIGPIAKAPNCYCAFGHHHIGLTGGPKTGRLIADMIARRVSNIDLAPFDVSRFTRQSLTQSRSG